MPDITPNLGIKKPLGNENVSRASFNENWDIIDANVAPVSKAQISKITADDGNVKYSVNDSSDFLVGLIALGVGIHTFYCVGTAVNAPPSGKTIRGFAHITGINPTNGYLMATDYTGVVYSNYVFDGVWTGWESHVTDRKSAWINLTLQNGWVGGYSGRTVKCAKVGNLLVIQGAATVGALGDDKPLFTLPTDYRPSAARVVTVASLGTGSTDNISNRLVIGTSGAVSISFIKPVEAYALDVVVPLA